MGSFPIKVTKRDEKFAINRSLRSDFGVMTVIFFYFLRLNSSVESKSRTLKVKNILKFFCTMPFSPANPYSSAFFPGFRHSVFGGSGSPKTV